MTGVWTNKEWGIILIHAVTHLRPSKLIKIMKLITPVKITGLKKSEY